MRIKFLSPAEVELDDAISYYDYELPGLGYRFLQEVDKAIKRISKYPQGWTKIGKYTRRCILKGFPYSLFYIIEKERIIITAVANLHRDPEYYKDRIS